tara:strand:- start:562 stop:810 length:249 start_codon:yes stop_codon:yes gene_type:complete
MSIKRLIETNKSRLSGFILLKAKLANAKLAGAELSGANLEESNLEKADLTGAVLSEANLHGARLKWPKSAPTLPEQIWARQI